MKNWDINDIKDIVLASFVCLLIGYGLFIMKGCIKEMNVRYKMELQHKIDNNLILPDKPLELNQIRSK